MPGRPPDDYHAGYVIAHMQRRPESQHYVTAGYLRLFLPCGERAFYVRRRDGQSWFRQRPENVATRKNFYSILKQDGEYDDRIEQLLSRSVEAPGIEALHKLNATKSGLSWGRLGSVAALISLQQVRLPSSREGMRKLLEAAHSMATDAFLDPRADPSRHLGKAYPQMSEAQLREKVRKLRHAWESGRIHLKIRDEATLESMLSVFEVIHETLLDMDWTVYHSNRGLFLTSDNPSYISPSSVMLGRMVGLRTPGVIVHFPISTTRFLQLSNYGLRRRRLRAVEQTMGWIAARAEASRVPQISFRAADQEMVEVLNRETCLCAEDFICAPAPDERAEQYLSEPQVRYVTKTERVGRDLLRFDHKMVEDSH